MLSLQGAWVRSLVGNSDPALAQCSQKTKTKQTTTTKNVQCNSRAWQKERITCAVEVGKKGCDYIGVIG